MTRSNLLNAIYTDLQDGSQSPLGTVEVGELGILKIVSRTDEMEGYLEECLESVNEDESVMIKEAPPAEEGDATSKGKLFGVSYTRDQPEFVEKLFQYMDYYFGISFKPEGPDFGASDS